MTKKLLIFFLLLSFQKTFSQVFINDFRVVLKDSAVKISSQITLNYQENHIAISFSDSTDAEGIFFYKLDNQELENSKRKWLKANNNRSITYAELFGGEYVFRVKNTHNKTETSVAFNIELLFWQNWWFIPLMFLYALVVIGIIIYLILLYRFRQQSKLQKVRNDIASDLHDDMGATLSSIAFSAALLKKRATNLSPEINELLNRIKDDAEDSITKVRETVWAINPQNDTSEDLFEKFRTLSIQLLASKVIELDFSNELDEHQTLKLTMAQRRNCYMIVKEVLHNIIKHSEASKVKFCIQKSANGIVILIEDNGIGFDQEQEFDGNGLLNFKKRAEESLMIFSLNAEIGIGTSIKLEINEQ